MVQEHNAHCTRNNIGLCVQRHTYYDYYLYGLTELPTYFRGLWFKTLTANLLHFDVTEFARDD